MESNALQLLGGGLSTRTERRIAEENALTQLFRPNARFDGGYSNAPKASHSLTSELPPPPYAPSEIPPKLRKKKSRTLRKEVRREEPPEYSCPHLMEGELDFKTELLSPFKLAKEQNWNPVYVVLRGPLLCLHRRAPHIITSEPQAGKLIKSYTLQHAESGLADDCVRVELEPLNARARMVLPRNRWEAYSKDRTMFQKIKFYILRLRVEEEQILLSTHSKTRAMAWLEALCSAMDIAPDIDERTDPRCFTETRNRARRTAGHLMRNRRLVREQERLFRDNYPQFAEERAASLVAPQATISSLTNHSPASTPGVDQEGEQLGEDQDDAENEEATAELQYPDWLNATTLSSRPSRPEHLHRSYTNMEAELTSLLPPSFLHLRLTARTLSSTDLDPETQKWRPEHPWTHRHDILYRRKCLPVLVSNAPRSSDIIVKDGKRLKIDWDKKVLIPLDAPLDFGPATEKEEAISRPPRNTASPLIWRRRQSPDAATAAAAAAAAVVAGHGPGNGASGLLERHVTRSSGSDSNETTSEDIDPARSRMVSDTVDRHLSGATGGEDIGRVGTPNGARRARRMLGDLFRPKLNSASVSYRRPSVTPTSDIREEI